MGDGGGGVWEVRETTDTADPVMETQRWGRVGSDQQGPPALPLPGSGDRGKRSRGPDSRRPLLREPEEGELPRERNGGPLRTKAGPGRPRRCRARRLAGRHPEPCEPWGSRRGSGGHSQRQLAPFPEDRAAGVVRWGFRPAGDILVTRPWCRSAGAGHSGRGVGSLQSRDEGAAVAGKGLEASGGVLSAPSCSPLS